MAVWTLYLVAYLCGVATPILIIRNFVKDDQDGSSCFFNILLVGLTSLILIALWLGMEI